MIAGGVTIGGDHDALACREAVVLDHPVGTEAVECLVQLGGGVDDLAVRGLHTGGGHDVLGERLGTLDARGVGGRAEAGDACRADGVRDTQHQRNLGADHDEVCVELLRECCHRLPGRDVDGVLLGDLADPGVAGRAHQGSDTRIASKGEKEGMFTGSGADNEYAHGCQPTGRPEGDGRSVRSRQSRRFGLPFF